nr:hypothetical protein [Tanacetum cinerariifolium]
MKNYKNISQDIHDQLNAEAEAVQIILTGIDNDIYSTVDACPNACKMWKAIERKFTSRDGKSLESYYSWFYKMMNELVRNQCGVTNHQVNVQFLLQLQPEWQRSQQAATRNRGKAIVNSPSPIYDQEPFMVAEDDEMSKDKEIDKLMALISLSFKKIYKPTNNNLRMSSNTSRANQDNSPRINRGIGYDNQRIGNVARAKENVAYHKEKMLFYKKEEDGFQLNAEQADWKDDTDDEFEDQELEARYMFMAKLQEVTPDAVDNSGPSLILSQCNKVQADHDDANDMDNERELLASLIEKLKCKIDDNKNRNKFLETSNKALVDKLKGEIEDFKTKNKSSESSNNRFKEANNELSKTNELITEKELSVHQETISILSQAKEAQIKLYKTREDKELDKVIALENKVKVLDNIVYKTGQSVQTMNMLNRNCKTSFSKPEFLKKSQRANPRMYDIGCYNDNLALMLAPESDEVIRLERESRSNLSDLIRPFDYEKLNNLYDLFVP